MISMTLTGTFTLDELMKLSNKTALKKLIEIRRRGLSEDFIVWADDLGDWDDIHDILNCYTVNEILEIEEDESEDESEDE